MEYSIQGHIIPTTARHQVIDWGVNVMKAPEAWSMTKGKGVKVAILDTGIDRHHPDLLPNLKGGVNFAGGSSKDYQDRQGHGSHCAGIIAGCDNGIGVIGIAPQCDIYAVKVLGDNGSGSLPAIIRGIDWCIAAGMDVISMSLGGSGQPPEAFHDAFKRAHAAGIPVIVASGNEDSAVSYPAIYPETIAVGAINPKLERAQFSNHGNELDVMAPGVDIYSTIPVNAYGLMSGTSMATPMVAGAVALYVAHKRAHHQSYTVQDVQDALEKSAVDLGLKGYDANTGYGLIDLAKLLTV